jgi:hypothetical protein
VAQTVHQSAPHDGNEHIDQSFIFSQGQVKGGHVAHPKSLDYSSKYSVVDWNGFEGKNLAVFHPFSKQDGHNTQIRPDVDYVVTGLKHFQEANKVPFAGIESEQPDSRNGKDKEIAVDTQNALEESLDSSLHLCGFANS